jgi:tagatose 1,6-diphosphate aldolase
VLEKSFVMSVRISQGKFQRLNACANEHGVISALAVDHRDNLLHALADARQGPISAEDMSIFKSTIIRLLSPYTSAVLLDPRYGLPALESRATDTGALLAYEKSSYGFSDPRRLPDLLPDWSVRRLLEAGAQGIKILLYYDPFDDPEVQRIKQAYVERIGAECQALDIPFFLEPLVYDHQGGGNEKSLEFARKKPGYVAQVMHEFSQSRYGVDILKVELPVNPAFVEGSHAFQHAGIAYSRQEALEHFRSTIGITSVPFIYLSAGDDSETFCEMLTLSAEAGVKFSGVLCGRATWQGGIPAYAHDGDTGLAHWLVQYGIQNVQTLNKILLETATPWWNIYGGKDAIEVDA